MSDNIMENEQLENTSGKKAEAVLPNEAKRFNWGAFFFTWIWGLVNNSFLTLISLAMSVGLIIFAFMMGVIAGVSGSSEKSVIVVGFLMNIIVCIIDIGLRIWFGVKGNEWAWRNKRWRDVEHFNSVQRTWAIVGTVIFGLGISVYVLFFALIILLALIS